MINPQWLELLMSRIICYGSKDVRAIEDLLYYVYSARVQAGEVCIKVSRSIQQWWDCMFMVPALCMHVNIRSCFHEPSIHKERAAGLPLSLHLPHQCTVY